MGTVAFSCVEDTWFTDEAVAPLNFTTDVPLKPTPLIVTTVPTGPLPGLKLTIERVGVKLVELVPVPAAVVTEIFPGIAPLGTVAVSCAVETKVYLAPSVPNFTLAPGTKFVPLIVTVLPVIPDAGENEDTVGTPVA